MTLRHHKFNTIVLLLIGLILTLATGLVLSISFSALKNGIEQSLEEATQPLVSTTARLLFNPLYNLDAGAINEILDRSSNTDNILYIGVRDSRGQLISDTTDDMNEWMPDESRSLTLAAQAFDTQTNIQKVSADQSVIVSPITVGPEQIGTIEFVFVLTQLRTTLEKSQRTIIVTTLLSFGGAILAISLLTRSLTTPLNQLVSVAEEIGQGNLNISVEPQGTLEMVTLATSLEQMRSQLQDSFAKLEGRIAARTHALVTSSEINRRISVILDREKLASEVVTQVQSAFGYYHVHIYLLNETGTVLELIGGTGEAGQKMLARKHKLGSNQGLIGRATSTNQVVLIPDVLKNSEWLPNPLLPETKAEIAVPIAIGDQVLGVLDVQHHITNGLAQKDVDLLLSITHQMAIALQNARLLENVRQQSEQEAKINNIARQIQNTTTVDEALQIAVREIGRAVGSPQTAVRLTNRSEMNNGNN